MCGWYCCVGWCCVHSFVTFPPDNLMEEPGGLFPSTEETQQTLHLAPGWRSIPSVYKNTSSTLKIKWPVSSKEDHKCRASVPEEFFRIPFSLLIDLFLGSRVGSFPPHQFSFSLPHWEPSPWGQEATMGPRITGLSSEHAKPTRLHETLGHPNLPMELCCQRCMLILCSALGRFPIKDKEACNTVIILKSAYFLRSCCYNFEDKAIAVLSLFVAEELG